MINEEKVILMTRLASYEKREGKNNMTIGKYFRGDFVSLHLLKAVIAATICYFVAFGLYLLYFIEELMAKIYEMDFVLFAKNAISIYVIFVAIYCCLSYVVFSYRYVKARKGIRRYYHNLKKLSSMSRQ